VAVLALMAEAENLSRGDLMSFALICEATGLERGVAPWQTVIDKFKTAHEKKRGITIWSEPGKGYRLCSVEEQVKECPRRRRRMAARQLSKGIGHLRAAKDSGDVKSIALQHRLDGQLRALEHLHHTVRQSGNIAAFFSRSRSSQDDDTA
jgi:hypothetical protein